MTTIAKISIPERERANFLPRHFGTAAFLLVEAHIYAQLDRLCQTYRGGLWTFHELSNGGCFMAPDSSEPMLLANEHNDSSEEVSAEAAGIIACLYTFSALAFRPRMGHVGEHFHRLREFALEHPESADIFAVID